MTTHQKTAVVTGGTAGIGLETAFGLAEKGWRLIVTGRNVHKARRAAKDLSARGGGDAIGLAGDLSSQAGVGALASEIATHAPIIDSLVNNAGALDGERRVTADGLPHMIAVNHMAPWLLSNLLLPQLQAADKARIVVVTTSGHRFGQFDPEELEPRKGFVGLGSYADSKLLNLLTMFGWSEELGRHGISVFAADPGGAATDMTGAMDASYIPFPLRLAWPLMRASFGRSNPQESREKAARSSILAASDPALDGKTALYIGPKGAPIRPSRAASSAENQRLALALTRASLPVAKPDRVGA